MTPEERAELEELKREVTRSLAISAALYRSVNATAELAMLFNELLAVVATGRPNLPEKAKEVREKVSEWEGYMGEAYRLLESEDGE